MLELKIEQVELFSSKAAEMAKDLNFEVTVPQTTHTFVLILFF